MKEVLITEEYGVIYIWYDRKHKRYYIGSHWGNNPESDGYICSSNRMRNAYKKRPEDFKRRIISKIYTSRYDLLEEENLILRRRSHKKDQYYNLKFFAGVHYYEMHSEESKAKMSASKKNMSDETKAKMSASKKGRFVSEETKAKMSASHKGKINGPRSEETKSKLSDINIGKKHTEESKAKMSAIKKGKVVSEETKAKMSASKKNMTEETKAKMSASHKGKVLSEETKAKISASKKGNSVWPSI